MEFRLLYSGRVLGSSKTNTRADLKHEIRREFHPQLRRLWQTNESLREVVKRTGSIDYDRHYDEEYLRGNFEQVGRLLSYDEGDSLFRELGADIIADKWERFGFHFWPLVTEEYCVRCSLDILFLRPEEPGMIIRSGDIDARMKTIFDALRMPKNLDEAGGIGPQDGENPFFCLLEDDKLISDIRVDTDNLLMLPREKEINSNDAMLVIHVKLRPTKQNAWDWAFF